MNRLALHDLIIIKPHPTTTLKLEDAFLKQPQETVETYIFTESIRHYFEEILDTVVKQTGQGFWVQAEYGAGKTHFLAAIASLLANITDGLWDKVSDNDIRQFQRRLGSQRLLPVVCSLRGEASADPNASRTLMDVLLEKGFRPALERAGLTARVKLTSTEDLMEWFDKQTTPAFRTEFEASVKRSTGMSLKQERENEGDEAVAALLFKHLESSGLKPDIAVSVRDRLASIYRQLTKQGSGYNGVLLIIDEYEGWANIRSGNVQFRAQDEDLLETLGYILPKDMGMAIHTIVASQSAVPAKLHGSQEGDRFINLPLLADQNERDYDIIASRRVRALNQERLPEIADYYRYYSESFEFARQLNESEFRDIFPFQPRCFEIVRRITSRDLPGPRSGIEILYQMISDESLSAKNTLIRASDLMNSPHLVEDCLSKPVYKKHYDAFRLALQELPTLALDSGDQELAQSIIATLYLWYEAFIERARSMSLKDLTQATLTASDVIKAEDNVAYVLNQLQALQQIQFDNQNAQFVPVGGEGPSPVAIFKDFVRHAQTDPYAVRVALTNSLFLSTEQTRSQPGLFADFQVDQTIARSFDNRNLQYQGEVVVASRWQMDWSMPLTADDAHFRVIIMTPDAAQSVKSTDLQDPRVAIVFPGAAAEDVFKIAAEYLAWTRMWEQYEHENGKDAETIREWLLSQRSTYVGNLIQKQLGLYRNGTVMTRDDLGISANEAFGAASNERRVSFIVEKLLSAAYQQLPIDFASLRSTLSPAEAGKVFEGYFAKDPGGAQTTATRNYGIGLGLSQIDQPSRFAPQPGNKALTLIGDMLAEQKGSDLPVWKLYERLSRPPYGLPYVVIQLYLVAFVRQGSPRADLLLKRDHKLKTRDGKLFGRDRINAASVATIQWRPGLQTAFDSLIPAVGPNWNDVLGFAREVAEDLHTTTDQAEIELQTHRLNERLSALGDDLSKQRSALGVLGRALNVALPDDALQTFESLEGLVQTRNGYASFFEKSEELFKTPDGLRDALKTVHRTGELAAITAEVTEVKRYLDNMRLRESDRELNGQRTALLGQIELRSLADQPHLWGSIKANFDQFKIRYRNEYQKHHRDSNASLQKLSDSLSDTPRQLNALRLLNTIKELGPARGEELSVTLGHLNSSLKVCPVTDYLTVSIESDPVCAQCKRDLTYTSPAGQVESFRKDLASAIAEQQRSLASEAIRRVLERGKGDALSQFVQAAQAANIAALVDLLDEKIVQVILKLLAEEQIGVAEGEVIGKFLQQYGSLEEGDIAEAVKAFEMLLHEAFKEAKKANKGKKTIRLTLK